MDTAVPTRRPPDDAVAASLSHLDRDQLLRLVAASQEFNSTLDLTVLLPRVLDMVVRVVEAEAGSVWLCEGSAVRCEYALGPVADAIIGLELPSGAGIVGDVVERGEPDLVSDVSGDGRFLHQIDEATGFETRTVMTVPLKARGEVLGAIQVVNDLYRETFTPDDLQFLVALADDAAAALRNARLFEAEKRARDLRSLLELSQEITATFDLDRILLSVVNLAGRAIPFDRCVLALESSGSVAVRAVSGEESADRKSAAVRELERFLGWVRERAPDGLSIPRLADPGDELAGEVALRFPDYVAGAALAGLLVVPVRDADGPLGVLLFEFGRPDVLTPWSREAAELLANQAALALRNAQLYRDVPFIGWLEPLAEKRRALASLPASAWLRWGAVAAALLLPLTLLRLPLRVAAAEAAVRPALELPVRAGVAGIVEAVLVREGDRVEPGQPLARLRDEALLRSTRETAARLERAEREVLAAEAAGLTAAAALARSVAAEAEDVLALLREQVDESWLRAPAAGVVLTPRLEERVGGFLEAGGVLAWVGDPDWVELELRVAQADIGEVRVGDPVRARVSAHPAVTFEGRVTEIAPGVERTDDGPLYTVRAVLDNRERLLKPGMEASARVHAASRPLGALILRRPWRWLRLRFWW